ncbi:LuxS/MPP-like metallohydrolase [Neoconidiobolus thromboides FSU 785]|nr:LuxS/MPP-like metallohydrolase [Neoconidiobolus thromboides FSU 785]
MIRTINPIKSLRACQRATYASTSAIAPEAKITSGEFGVKLVSQDSGAPLSTLSLFVKAGSRYETKYGVAHYLKNFAYKNTTKRTSFRITREAELQGATISAALSRENIVYTAQFFREDTPYFIESLSDVLQHTKFADYELLDVAPQVAFETAASSSEAQVIDSIHNVAFRQGLGNSIFAKSNSGVNINDIKSYAQQALNTKDVVFAGINIDHEVASQQLNELFYDTTASSGLSTQASKYHGGEVRAEASGPYGHIAYAFEGAAYGSDKEATLLVLKHLLGGQNQVKWGEGVSPLAKVANTHQDAQISAFNFSYSDAGLFGIYVKAPTKQVASATEAALAKLKEVSSKLSQDELKRAINQAKLEVLVSSESQSSNVHHLGSQVSLIGKSLSTSERIAQIEKVSEKELSESVKQLIATKPSISIQGSLNYLPYADQLKL